ncbi:hypothetical protein OHC33_002152 [Knufia fluminis]|uniref:Uncharacterized protein n=1 Tax=Knufia fluminis TaxID=191047 RepID=A0AAN8FE28_9EURO|nr:hypothetical protein OHC33_002152 [Knufia fluminis]
MKLIQALLQIIINRVSLLIIDKTKAAYITWGVAVIMTLINISVFVIWIPARLQISEKWIRINKVWDPIEKGIYLVIDGCLNGYFLYLVHSKLVSAGMTKYRPLFKFNAFIIVISLSMDILIIAMMNLKNSWVYTQFHPLAYIVKLNIELTMASLITKIAKQPGIVSGSSGGHRSHRAKDEFGNAQHVSKHGQSGGHPFLTSVLDEYGRRPVYDAWCKGPEAQAKARQAQIEKRRRRAGPAELEDLSDSDESLEPQSPPIESADAGVIVKTTELAITTESIEMSERDIGDTPSEHESTTDLNQHKH